MICEFCGETIESGVPYLYAVSGWEEPREQGGANVIHLRHRLGPVACKSCVQAAKPRQQERRRAEQPTLDVSKTHRAQALRPATWGEGSPMTARERAFYEGDA